MVSAAGIIIINYNENDVCLLDFLCNKLRFLKEKNELTLVKFECQRVACQQALNDLSECLDKVGPEQLLIVYVFRIRF